LALQKGIVEEVEALYYQKGYNNPNEVDETLIPFQ
jgi:hypothetical protein